MRRRELVAGLAACMLSNVSPQRTEAQQAFRRWIGILSLGPVSPDSSAMLAFRRGLAESGFFEEQNISFKFRADYREVRFREIAEDLLSRQPTLIVAIGGPGPVLALKAATSTVPIVFISGLDPISYGFVSSLNRPGGNITGITFVSSETIGKRLALLLELVPQAEIIGYLSGPSADLVGRDWLARTMESAEALGREIVVREVRRNADIEEAFASFVERRVSAITVAPHAVFGEPSRSQTVIEFAARYKLPAVYGQEFFTRRGGLMSYAADIDTLYHQLGRQYVAPILKGAKPADLPVQQPTKFNLVINLKAARALGLTIPETLLATANELIQ
jgi:putative tryptophan/tyrosine transport system substrate-binding protein